MASNVKQLREAVKEKWFNFLATAVAQDDNEVLRTASNEFAVPVVDSEGGEHYIVVTVKIPTGSREGDPYDGYAMAQEYALKCEAKRAKQADKERKAQANKSKSKSKGST